MAEKFIIMSLNVRPDTQESLKLTAKKLGMSVSQLVRELVDGYLGAMACGEPAVPLHAAAGDSLGAASERMGCSVADLVDRLVEKYLPVLAGGASEIPVLLRIPAALKGDRDGLDRWLSVRKDALVQTLCR